MNKQTLCPKCVGAKTIMEPRTTRGFDYNKCSLCEGTGIVTPELADDYIFSLNEESINDEQNY